MSNPRLRGGDLRVLQVIVQPRENPDWPQARILVDGLDIFEAVAPGWVGFDPDQLLGGDSSPLVPGHQGRRVAVCRCSCGEAGCGVIAPIIGLSANGKQVLWRDFRDFTGVFVDPISRYPQVEQIPSRRWDVPDLRFDREQYLDTIAGAAQDRSWETPQRQTARLLTERLAPLGLVLPPDLPLDRAYPEWDGDGVMVRFGVEFEDGTVHCEELRLVSIEHDPDQAARSMASGLLDTPSADWSKTFGV